MLQQADVFVQRIIAEPRVFSRFGGAAVISVAVL